ncbi:hypothetical protein BOX15_Mlig026408g5, partial [Macrostomum lignano]
SRRENSDFESQAAAAAAAAAAYAEDLFSGVVNGRDESNLLLPLDEAPHELRLNWVLADTGDELGGGDCVDIEATIHILEPETALPRTNRRERARCFAPVRLAIGVPICRTTVEVTLLLIHCSILKRAAQYRPMRCRKNFAYRQHCMVSSKMSQTG